MDAHNPPRKNLASSRHHRLVKIALLVMLAGISVLIICLPHTAVEARYQLQERIGFVVTIPAAPN